MHCEALPIALGVIAAAVPSFTLLRLRSIMRLNDAARTQESSAGGVRFAAVSTPSLLDRSVKRAFDKRDDQIMRLLHETLHEGGSVLDVGCGDGKLLAALQKEGFDVHGIEISIDMIEQAAQKIGPRRVRRGDLLDCWDASERVDAVLFCDSIRYTTRPQQLLDRALRVARYVIVSEPVGLWHVLGRALFLRFLYRVGHLSRLSARTLALARRHRTFFHNFWIFDAGEERSQDHPSLLEQDVLEEAAAIERQLVHPGIVRRIRRLAAFAIGATFASAATLALYAIACTGGDGGH